MTEVINKFEGEYRFLSNFWESPFVIAGETIRSVEHAYQAAKALTEDECNAILALDTPGLAKKAGKKLETIRPDWDRVKVTLMTLLVTEKFIQNKELTEKLLATGDAELQEGNWWGDTFWGVDINTGKGENTLGKILMKLREDLLECNTLA